MTELTNNFIPERLQSIDPLLLWGGVIVALVLLSFGFYTLINWLRRKPARGRKLSILERLQIRRATILLKGDKGYKPRMVTMSIQNPGKRPVDLQAPVLIFKRWTSRRKFRLNSISGFDDFPIWLEPGYEAKWEIDLEQFYNRIPELRRACRLSIEMKEISGKRFISRDLRLKWM